MTKDQSQTADPDSAVCGRLEPLVRRLRQYNDWRRGADTEQPNPREIGADIDDAIQAINVMRDAIRKTITENGHLTDGDDCTLRHLTKLFDSA